VVELGGDEAALALQFGQQGGRIRHAHHLRNYQPVRFARGQAVGLGILQVLQAMLEVAQESVGVQQAGHGLRRQQLALGQQAQGGAGRAFAQCRVAPAADQLEHLGQEFDLADAAAPQLDVVAALGMQALLAADLGADLGVHGADRVDHAEIEVAPEHERAHDCFQRGDVQRVAGDRARLDPGVALPLAALHDQVFLDHREAGRQRAGLAVRAQRHVDAEGETVLGDFGQRRDQLLAEADKELVVRQLALAGAGGGIAILRVDEDQVDIGRDVQLEAALLAHGNDDHLLRPAGFLADRLAVQGHHLVHQGGGVLLNSKIGKTGDRGDHFVQVGLALQVAPDDGGQQQVAQAAHGAHQGQAGRKVRVQYRAEIEASQR
jgi:hypothetical protein